MDIVFFVGMSYALTLVVLGAAGFYYVWLYRSLVRRLRSLQQNLKGRGC